MDMDGGSEKKQVRVLVVDDDDCLLDLVQRFLQRNGYSVVTADDGQAALDLCYQSLPHIILMDAEMPGMDGFAACRALKQNPSMMDVPIIMVTGLDDNSSVERGFDAGAEEYITKPINFSVLARRMQLILEKKQAEQMAAWELQSRQLISTLLQAENPTISLKDQLEKSLDMMLEISWLPSTGSGSIFLRDDKRKMLHLVVHRNVDPMILKKCATVPFGHCLCGLAADSRQVVYCRENEENVKHGATFKEQKRHGHYCVPIESGGRLLGVLNLYVHPSASCDARLQSALLTICKALGNIVERKRMEAEIRRHRDKLAFERTFVEQILQRMRASKRFDATHLRFLNEPVETTGGDLLLSAFCSDGTQHVLLGDFTGHGLPGAVGGPIVSDIFYAMTGKNLTMAEIFAEVNSRLHEKMPVGMFLAAGFMELSDDRRRLTVWNCTIPDILIFRRGKLRHRIPSGFFARGMSSQPDGAGHVFEVKPGDRVIAYTDGFIEESDEHGEMFGQEAFEQLLIQIQAFDQPLELLLQRLREFRDGPEPSDDMSIVELIC